MHMNGGHVSQATALMPPLQPDLVVGHPVSSNTMMPVNTHVQQPHPFPAHSAAASPAARASSSGGQVQVHADLVQPAVANTTHAAPTMPADSTPEGKKATKPRPRHIIHVGSELKDAVTRLTAMLPTSGPVAEIVQPLLDNSYKTYECVLLSCLHVMSSSWWSNACSCHAIRTT
jgi:hypothetical protein